MKITEINIPAEDASKFGLKPVKMSRLNNIVLIAGKNGAGKTRLFELIKHVLATKEGSIGINNLYLQLENNLRSIKEHEEHINKCNNDLQSGELPERQKKYILEEIKERNLHINNHIKNNAAIEKILNWNKIVTDQYYSNYRIVDYVPKGINLALPENYTKADLRKLIHNTDELGVSDIEKGVLAKIQHVQDLYYESTHQYTSIDEITKTGHIGKYLELKKIIKEVMGSDLGRDMEGGVTLFDLPLNRAGLSSGQKVLLQFIVAMFSQGKNLSELTLFLDEPENHLHPAALIEVLDKLQSLVSKGQIWISTHSINVLAHYDPSNIWYMNDNEISWAGRNPDIVLKGLLGDGEEKARLEDFLGLPASYATIYHAFECLFEPKAVNTGSADIQTNQIRTILQRLFAEDRKVRLLDFGAGKGRLLGNIFDQLNMPIESFTEKFDYIAYDKYDNDKEECCALIKTIYGTFDKRHYTNLRDVFSDYGADAFDVAVLCNVFHEMDPRGWIDLFKEDGQLTKILNPSGFLLVVEDMQMPHGEKAYQNGFIVFDTPEFRTLFDIKVDEAKGFCHEKALKNERIKAHLIPKDCLKRISMDKIKLSLNNLRDEAKRKVVEIRDREKTYKNGQEHAFWVQQLANTTLALGE